MSIDLGQKSEDLGCHCPTVVEPCASKVHYPWIFLTGGSELKVLPESGTITFRFKRTSKSEREREGKKSCDLDLECREIVAFTSSEDVPDKPREKVLDDLKKESEDEED